MGNRGGGDETKKLSINQEYGYFLEAHIKAIDKTKLPNTLYTKIEQFGKNRKSSN